MADLHAIRPRLDSVPTISSVTGPESVREQGGYDERDRDEGTNQLKSIGREGAEQHECGRYARGDRADHQSVHEWCVYRLEQYEEQRDGDCDRYDDHGDAHVEMLACALDGHFKPGSERRERRKNSEVTAK